MKTKQNLKISINPPPQDSCCMSCGKNVKDLKPFGKAGDPLVGDFNGALLVKTFRSMAPKLSNEELNKRFEDVQEKGFYIQLVNTVEASWECRDCIVLNDKEYFKPMEEKRRENEM